MAIWTPDVPVESNRVLEVNRSNAVRYSYSLPGNKTFPAGSTAQLVISNSYGQGVASWDGVVAGGKITFNENAAEANGLKRGDSWQLTVRHGGVGEPYLLAQGTVIRNEAPYPDAPPQSSAYDGVRYSYSFGTPGFLVDPAWRIMAGRPYVYDNSGRTLPNAVASGVSNGWIAGPWDKVAMLYYAPLRTDAVRLIYNTIRSAANSSGEMMTVICSNYDMTNWVGFWHRQVWGIGSWDNDQLAIVTGTGPTTFTIRATVAGDTVNNQNYTASYNPITNTYAMYKGTALTPTVSWVDNTGLVAHGEGERYVGFGFKSDWNEAGVQCSDWLIADAP